MFQNPTYLARGAVCQQRAYRALQSLDLFRVLRAYTPVLAGTIPLGIDIRGSDLDIICEARDLDAFARDVTDAFGARPGFRIERATIKRIASVIANFEHAGFPIEIFGQPKPVTEQNAYRHLIVEARLLKIGGERARRAIRQMKNAGLKTEPAFARYFGIAGDPYEELLRWSRMAYSEWRIANSDTRYAICHSRATPATHPDTTAQRRVRTRAEISTLRDRARRSR